MNTPTTVRELFGFAPLPWADQAECLTADPDMFFPEKGDSTREAKRICAHCPVVEPCLDWALSNDEKHGVWGGTSRNERRRLTHERRAS